MNSIFKVCKSGTCGIAITGLERDSNEYLTDPTTVSVRNYTFLQSITLNALTSIKSDGTETLNVYGFVSHITDTVDESDFDMATDGLYEVTHIILPTDAWLASAISKNSLTGYTLIYYYDTTSSTLKKYANNVSTTVNVEEVLAVNSLDTTTIIRSDKNTFCMCRLNDCFYAISKTLLDRYQNTCYNKLDSVQYNIYLRDILWMAINVIKYLIDLTQYYEAQKILENVTQCNGICNTNTMNVSSGGGCGCNS